MRMFFMLMMAVGMGCGSHTVYDATDTPSPSTEEVSTQELTCSGSYVACGCGCCVGAPVREAPCLACDGGKALQAIIALDKERASNPNCAMAGCSIPVKYTYCATPSMGP